MQTLREQFHSVKGAEISHEEGLKSRLISSDNPCILTPDFLLQVFLGNSIL